jgi:hypothetical protein
VHFSLLETIGMLYFNRFSLGLGLVALFLLAHPDRIRSATPDNSQDAALEEIQDPGFDRFVDLKYFRDALATQNAPALCDVALQLSEGERVLLRPYKGLPALRVFKLAIRVAGDRRDTPTLLRLEKAVKARGDKELAEKLEIALTLAKASRRNDSGLEQGSAEVVLLFRSFQNEIKVARSVSDVKELDRLKEAVGNVSEMSEKQRTHLVKLINEAREAASGEADDGDDMLRKLASASRSSDRAQQEAELRRSSRAILIGVEAPVLTDEIKDLMKQAGTVDRKVFEAHAKKMELDAAAMLTDHKYDEKGDVLVCGVITVKAWSMTGVGAERKRVALPSRYVPYFAIQQRK